MKPAANNKPKTRPRFQRRRFCKFCAEKSDFIDYKDIRLLRYYLTEKGKMMAARMTGTCAKHQRELMKAVKRARNIALLPFIEK
ncbi:MAG: 30S ribosomal protein S18 [Nitrospirae bacterium]|nr:30S ribosomal protein S18 [Nitrospirota bacterium]